MLSTHHIVGCLLFFGLSSLVAGPSFSQTSSSYSEPTAEAMKEALLKNKEVTSGFLMGMMFDRVKQERFGFDNFQQLKTNEALAILARVLQVEKGRCVSASPKAGFVCGFKMILKNGGWEEEQDPGRGRFFQTNDGWNASGS